MQNLCGTPFVAKVLERQERRADLLGLFEVLLPASLEERSGTCGSDAARTSSEARQAPLPQMNDRGAFTDSADHLVRTNAAQQTSEIFVFGWILTNNCVLNCHANAAINQLRDSI